MHGTERIQRLGSDELWKQQQIEQHQYLSRARIMGEVQLEIARSDWCERNRAGLKRSSKESETIDVGHLRHQKLRHQKRALVLFDRYTSELKLNEGSQTAQRCPVQGMMCVLRALLVNVQLKLWREGSYSGRARNCMRSKTEFALRERR